MTSNTIQYFSEEIDFALTDPDKITEWLMQVCAQEGKPIDILSFIFCSDEYLLQINKDYLNHAYYTDVISFPYSTDNVEGDIFISIDRVKENALTHKVSFTHELSRVMVHGVLHFLGYKDKNEDEQLVMRAKEDEYLLELDGS